MPISDPDRLAIACPVVLRRNSNGTIEGLAFRHPQAGLQILKGSVEEDETAKDAAVRELKQESGVATAGATLDLGKSNGIYPGESWHFFLCQTPALPDEFSFDTNDQGHIFKFFWQGFAEYLDEDWDPRFIRALRHIEAKVEKLSAEKLTPYIGATNSELANAIIAFVKERAEDKAIDPSEIARHLAGNDEKEWSKHMKPIRNEAVRLAKQGDIKILRKGKEVDPDNFKGIYRIGQ